MRIENMTIDEFKALIGEVVEEKLKALLFDPDYGHELRDEIEVRLKASLNSRKRVSLQEVKDKLGLL
jgi:hypothetical protein